jgi:hypothetical protein
MKMEQPECSEMSAYKIQKPGNHPLKKLKTTFPLLPVYLSEFGKGNTKNNALQLVSSPGFPEKD